MCSQVLIALSIPIIILICVGTSIFIVGRINEVNEMSVAGIAIVIVTFILIICLISSCLHSGFSYRPPSDIEMAIHRQAEIQYIHNIEHTQITRPIIERSDSARDIYSQN